MNCKVKSFAFLTMVYNHEKYIVEHLESIKHLILEYGQDIEFQFVINDDTSSDNTIALIERWLGQNSGLFRHVDKFYNNKNIGTCSSIANMVSVIKTDYCKLAAGDDVYSYENLFEAALLLDQHEIVSGLPLYLVEGLLYRKAFDLFNHIATNHVYKNDILSQRFQGVSFNNAPNILYKTDCLKNNSIMGFVSQFDVVEDWPIQIAIAEDKENAKFFFEKKVYVYYRRTNGSTYMVASKRLIADMKRIYDFLITKCDTVIGKYLLKNRKYCFLIHSRIFSKVLNISIYRFYFRVIFNLRTILKDYRGTVINVQTHKEHYKRIQTEAMNFLSQKY